MESIFAMERNMILYIIIYQEFVPDRLLKETMQIVPILEEYIKKNCKFRFNNEKIELAFNIDQKIDLDIKNIILNNKIKFSKSINAWPRRILNIDIQYIDAMPFIHSNEIIENKIYHALDINMQLPDIIKCDILKELNLQYKDGKYYVYTLYPLKDYKIFINIIKKTIEDKLNDIDYFMKCDMKIDNFDILIDKIHYFNKAGSYLDKTNRLIKISEKFFPNITNSAKYCKYDLCTNMVYEYPSLQGKMGAIYFNDYILSEQYLYNIKQFTSKESKLLALIDNIDKLCAYIYGEATFTSSRDPFALKRSVNLIIQIILDENIKINELIYYNCSFFQLDINVIYKILLNRLKNTEYKNIIVDNIDDSIQNIIYYQNNKKRIDELKTIYNRLSPLTDKRLEYTNDMPFSFTDVTYEQIDIWLKTNHITSSEKNINIVACILYQIETNLNIHLF